MGQETLKSDWMRNLRKWELKYLRSLIVCPNAKMVVEVCHGINEGIWYNGRVMLPSEKQRLDVEWYISSRSFQEAGAQLLRKESEVFDTKCSRRALRLNIIWKLEEYVSISGPEFWDGLDKWWGWMKNTHKNNMLRCLRGKHFRWKTAIKQKGLCFHKGLKWNGNEREREKKNPLNKGRRN